MGVALLATLSGCVSGPRHAVPNDNRVDGGRHTASGYEVILEARLARWKPDSTMDSTVTVMAFAGRSGAPRIPGPLMRVVTGKAVKVTVVNSIPDSTIVVHGLLGSAGADTLIVPSGERREVSFTAGAPGTYLYWASSRGHGINERTGRDAQLTGAFVVDDDSILPDTAERIFVITTLDILPDSAVPLERRDDIFKQVINGRSWPHTEPIRATAGDTLRWRWLNGGYLPHPMHLHGFHFRGLAKGNGAVDTLFAPESQPLAVTEMMRAGSTFRMEFTPTRPGKWLFHCHMVAHITPFPPRPDSVRGHELHDATQHPRTAMAGLVMGVHVEARADAAPGASPGAPVTRLRLLAQESKGDSGRIARRGFVLERGATPRPDSVAIPGTPLILTRGERVQITVVNRLSQHTSVHWHGMELDPYFDGVAGWSGDAARTSPMIAPGDSFTVAFTPPRAGTFIYHSHLEEEPQLHYGMFGAMIVLEPGERYDPASDLLFVLGDAIDGGQSKPTMNGQRAPAPMTLRAGRPYRVRVIAIAATEPSIVAVRSGAAPIEWTPIAKDGADLPAARQVPRTARFLSGVGETFDFTWTPTRRADVEFLVTPAIGRPDTLRATMRVRP
jgi:FtsP/CotA-like multicopper oxidase with cupredoxin domain